MKKQTMKVRIPILVLVFSLWILSSGYPAYAQQIRWLCTSELQSFINEIGAEYETESLTGNYNYFTWPSKYGTDQNTMRMQALWIGCKNFNDPVEKKVKSVKVIGSGPRDFNDRINVIFPLEIKLIGRASHPNVTVDNQPASIIDAYDQLDEVDENLPCDRMVLARFNTSIGVSVTKKVMAFSNSEHGNYFINDYVFKNTGIIDKTGTIFQQTLNDVWFYFFYRFAFAGVTSPGYGSTWGAFESTWGETTLNHAFGENPSSTDFEMRGFYSYYGPSNHPIRQGVYEEDWGCPNLNEGGVLGSAKYAGCVTLHADTSPNNSTDDLSQPKTTWFISSDINIMTMNVSQYDETFMADRYTAMSEGHPPKQHDEFVGNDYPVNYSDPRRNTGGGTSQGQGFGPYTLAPGDSIHIVFAEAVSGISWEKCREVGSNWLQWRNGIGNPQLIMPNGSTTTDYNLYKRKWCETGKDSILKTYYNAVQNYKSGYQLPQALPPPIEFIITSDSDRIRLTWANNAEMAPHFDGYIIYRSEGSIMDYRTVYQKIFECGKSNVVHSFDDITAQQGLGYYYYIQSKDDGSTNVVNPGIPLASSKFFTMSMVAARQGVAKQIIDSTGQWVNTNGPSGCSVSSLIVSQNGGSGKNIFIGTSDNGIFLFTDDGTSWTAINNGLTNINIYSLAVSGINLFAGTSGGGVFLSTNNGTSWIEVNSGLTNKYVHALAVLGTNLFAGTGSGVFRSTNNGTKWTAINTGLTGLSSIVQSLAVSGTKLFAGTGGGVYLSNNVTNWTPASTGLTSTWVYTLAVSGTNLFAGAGGNIFLSTNNGTSWTNVNNGIKNSYLHALVSYNESSKTDIFAGTSAGVFISTNDGISWTETSNGLTSTYVSALAISPNGTGNINLYAGTGGGVFLSTNNGTSWTNINNGIKNSSVGTLVSYDKAGKTNIFAGTKGGVFLSTDNATNWNAINNGLTNFNINVLSVSSNESGGINLFAGTDDGIFISTNDGTSWTAINNGLTNTAVYALAVSGTNLFAGTGGGVFLSANNGTSWTDVKNGLPNTNVYALAVSGTNLFAGTYGGGVFLSANNGTSWTDVNNGLPNTNVYALAVSGTNLFAGTGGGVFLSTNNGTSWMDVNFGLTNTYVHALAVDSNGAGGKNLFAGTEDGIFIYTNNGTDLLPRFSIVSKGIANTYIRSLNVCGTNLFAGTFSNGVWKRPISEIITGIENKNDQVPSHFVLRQNYPNPFNPSTNISFSLQLKGFVTLKVFDLLGREVATLINEELSVGKHTRQWNAMGVSSGVYFYRLQAGTYIETKKLILLK